MIRKAIDNFEWEHDCVKIVANNVHLVQYLKISPVTTSYVRTEYFMIENHPGSVASSESTFIVWHV